MSPSMVFLKKELRELVRTPKLLVLTATLLLFGFTGPILAKMIPEIMPQLMKDIPGGINFVIKTSGVDAWGQFLKNLNQMGLLIIVLMFMGTVSEECSKGTVLLVLTKPLPRPAFIGAKFLAATLLVTVTTGLGYLACLAYTAALFNDVHAASGAIATGLFLAYAILVLALTLFVSSVSKNQAVAAGLAVAGLVLISATSLAGEFGSIWSPGALSGLETNLIAGRAVWQDAMRPLLSTALLTTALLGGTVALFSRKEL